MPKISNPKKRYNRFLRPKQNKPVILLLLTTCYTKCHAKSFKLFAHNAKCLIVQMPGPKKWLILGVSLTHLVESRYLFFLEVEIVDNIFQ